MCKRIRRSLSGVLMNTGNEEVISVKSVLLSEYVAGKVVDISSICCCVVV